jgi:putative transposase
MLPVPVREKKHRLPSENYGGYHVVAFTCCIQDRKACFVSNGIFREFENILIGELDRFHCAAHIYLFMPDHGHLILQGRDNTADMWRCMVLFKQKTGFWFSKNEPRHEWQKDFFDHVLRKDEDLKKQVEYVLNNPVRKGLAGNWMEYPYKGSTVYDLNSWK